MGELANAAIVPLELPIPATTLAKCCGAAPVDVDVHCPGAGSEQSAARAFLYDVGIEGA